MRLVTYEFYFKHDRNCRKSLSAWLDLLLKFTSVQVLTLSIQSFHIKYEVTSLKIYHCKISSLTTHQIINKHPGNELNFFNFTYYLFIILDIFHVKYYNINSHYVKSAGYKLSQLPMEQVRLHLIRHGDGKHFLR